MPARVLIRYLPNNGDARAQAEMLASVLRRQGIEVADLRESRSAIRPELSFAYAPDETIAQQVDDWSESRPCAVPNRRMARWFAWAPSNSTFLAIVIWQRLFRLQQGRVTMNKSTLPFVLVASCLAACAAAYAADSSTPAKNPADAAKTDAPKAEAARRCATRRLFRIRGAARSGARMNAKSRSCLAGLQRRQAYCDDSDWHRRSHRRCGCQS